MLLCIMGNNIINIIKILKNQNSFFQEHNKMKEILLFLITYKFI